MDIGRGIYPLRVEYSQSKTQIQLLNSFIFEETSMNFSQKLALVATGSIAAFAVLDAPANAFSLAGTQIFINEIHYDNFGVDANEGFEIAAPTGTNLSGWSVVLYNGNDSKSYGASIGLSSATFANQNNGFGTYFFGLPENGLQNGPNDGLALINAANEVVQFLSYAGQLTASNGIANGLPSTNIGVAETSSTPVGQSLQLIGTGNKYSDFTWSAAKTNTYNAVNSGQNFTAEAIPTPALLPGIVGMALGIIRKRKSESV